MDWLYSFFYTPVSEVPVDTSTTEEAPSSEKVTEEIARDDSPPPPLVPASEPDVDEFSAEPESSYQTKLRSVQKYGKKQVKKQRLHRLRETRKY